jgi:DNA replicative helicase MCM subunit Mcm2 (Cdc46/Mcm family)
VAGILKADVAEDLEQVKNNIFSPYVLVSSIEELQSNAKKFDQLTIEKMKNDKQIFFNLVKSFCPSIFGH